MNAREVRQYLEESEADIAAWERLRDRTEDEDDRADLEQTIQEMKRNNRKKTCVFEVRREAAQQEGSPRGAPRAQRADVGRSVRQARGVAPVQYP